MPKLHDACQILAEDLISGLRRFRSGDSAYALAIAYHSVETDLAEREHPQFEEVSRHMWLVLDETIARLRPDLAQAGRGILEIAASNENPPLREDDIPLAYFCSAAVDEARRLFPTRKYRI